MHLRADETRLGHIVPSCPYKDWKNEGQGNRQITKHRRQHGRIFFACIEQAANILMKYQSFTWQCTISCVIRILLLIHCALSVKIGAGSLPWERQAAALHTLSGLYVFLQRGYCAHLWEFLCDSVLIWTMNWGCRRPFPFNTTPLLSLWKNSK